MGQLNPRSIEELQKFALERRFTQSKRLRKLIDRRKEIKQIFELDEKYYKEYNKFVDIYNAAIDGKTQEEVEQSREVLDFSSIGGVGKVQLRTAAKIVGGTANFRQLKSFYTKLIPELAQGYEFGHKNISILRSNIALVLDADADVRTLSKKERQQLLALYQLIKEIDAIEDITGAPSKIELVERLRNIAEAGPNVKAQWKKDVDILKGIKGSIEIEAEYTELNQFKGRLAAWVGEIFSGVVQGDEKIFEQYLSEVDISKMKGSNDLETDIEDAFSEYLGRGRKKNYKAKKPKPTVSKTKQSKNKPKPVTRPKRKRLKQAKTRPQAKKGPASQPLLLLTALAQKLPGVVEKNMGPPRLTNQTGRFASSVRPTEITQTAQGFPSIGYTYQRFPYETFEVGGRQGSQDYDPRKLIDLSIREIAAQFAIGRFYTRRE